MNPSGNHAVYRKYTLPITSPLPWQWGISIGYIPARRDITGRISLLAGILFIPCLGYSDLGRILSLPTEPKWCTFSALVNTKSSRSLGSGCDVDASQALSCTVQTGFAGAGISDPLSPVNTVIRLVGIA